MEERKDLDMSRLTVLFLLISFYCITCFKAENPCQGFYGATSHVHGVIGENISLTCHVSANCPRGYWKYDDNINPTWLVPKQYSGDTYFFNTSQGLTTLHIVNINDNVEGFYTCLCDYHNRSGIAHACYDLSVHVVQFPISVQINGEKHVFDICSKRSKAEMVDVEVNDNITIKCDDEAERRTNCLNMTKHISFIVKPSYHLCKFSCRPKGNSAKRELKWISLNVKNQNNSTTEVTSITVTSTTAAGKLVFTYNDNGCTSTSVLGSVE
ncbi:hypothetical protein HOLleu_24665 [Holothuria leucospilota]|uniref:Ig-like domain-containing protein n=1 Tax=Holothuria leucospilota TaxID=206669 RepID=A0A9Q1H3D5_HOLLE|nr:hypothetical protein HOLleu_24665 [Holothuria leucospilota]